MTITREEAIAELERRKAARAAQPKKMSAVKAFLFGDNDPTTQNMGEKIGSFLNKAGESMTMGLIGDEADAKVAEMMGGDYEKRLLHNRQQEEVFERDNPKAALTADIGGALVAPFGALGAVGKGAGLAKRIGASALATGAMSGTYGAMEAEGDIGDRLGAGVDSALLGGGIGALVPVAGAGAQRVANRFGTSQAVKAAARVAPTTEQLRAQGRAAYQAIDDAGVRVNPQAIGRMKQEIAQLLQDQGVGTAGANRVLPASTAIKETLEDVGAQKNTVPFEDLAMFRRFMGHAAGSAVGNKGDSRVATEALGALDDFVEGMTAADIDAGDLKTLQTMLPKAREVWARMSRSQTLDDAIENAADYRSGPAAGVAAQFQRIVKNPKLRRGFTDQEIKLMRRVVNGSIPEQFIRYAGSGLGMMGQFGIGAMSGPVGAALGAGTAYGSRALSNKIAMKNAENARAFIAAGGAKALPPPSETTRRFVEQLLRQNTATIPH